MCVEIGEITLDIGTYELVATVGVVVVGIWKIEVAVSVGGVSRAD